MAKKANNKQIFFLVAVVLGIAAILMNLLPFVKYHFGGDTNYLEANFSGFNCMFGAEGIKASLVTELGSVSGEAVKTELVVTVLIGGIVMVVGLLAALLVKLVDKKKAFLMKVVSAAAFIAGAVLVLALTKASFVSANDIGETVAKDYSLGIGAILSGVFSALAGVGIFLA
ncbi:MAG: hypothetical protein K6E21_05660 [Bacilli bacterium]|nr:hypothetical protein [Bacilli bacterium]